MPATHVNQKTEWTAEQRKSHQAIRDQFQGETRNLDELVRDGEVDPESVATLAQRRLAAQLASSLRSAREAAGMSLTDLAERSEIERSALSKLESGVNLNPTLSTLVRYAITTGNEIQCSLAEMKTG